ncbi:MAG: Ig-like domain-containing protein [Candidatus Bathyarchaeota archaeon]|nr:Ig-like domain-containing protein [Candidatus Bathyarchaeota archaeon]
MLFYFFPCGLEEAYSVSYQILNKPGGSIYYRLNVTIQQSLYDYYHGKSHTLNSEADFAKFVTPYALKPIADNLWEIYSDDEDFANGVLMTVHQIPYDVTEPARYPVETMVENRGDCDLFSFVAASIMKAGGLDVVLFYYEEEAHMNVGVNLSHAPHDARGQVYYITYNNIKYYIAECTGHFQDGWRVGECPDSLKSASVEVITLENCEQSSPGQVSASYKPLTASTISLNVSSSYVISQDTVTLNGKISPALQNKTVTIYVSVNNSPWKVLGTTTTDSHGRFTYVWNVETSAGVCFVRASWSGDYDYAGADSPIQTITILSTFFILLLTATMILVCMGIIIFIASKQTQQTIQEPQPPEIPS